METRTILAIDTALGTSVALGARGEMFTAESRDPRGHAEVIGTLLASVFEASGTNPGEVEAVVAGIGPGPFTGLRVGIAAAHAFAAGLDVSVLPLQGHEAVALEVLERDPGARVRVVQDARRRELFVTEYAGLDADGVPVRTADAHLETREAFAASDHDVWPELIPAAALVRLAERRLRAERGFEPDEALYLRAPDVKPAAAVKRVSA